MAVFKFAASVTVSAFTSVEAENEADAREIAEGRPVALGGINSGESDEESWIIDEADGEPMEIRLSHDHEE